MKETKKNRIRKHVKKIIIFSFLFFIFIIIAIPLSYPWLFYNPPRKNEVVIIGLEGATWRVIKPLIEKNKLPNFKFLVQNETYLTVNSSIFSDKVWDRVAKGKFDKSFWELTSEKNKTTIILYWPNHNKTEIHDLKKFLLINPLSEFLKKLSYLRILIPINKADKDLIYDFYLLDFKMREFFYSREKLKPDISGIVLSELPRLQLYYWAYMQPERFKNINDDEIKKYGTVIEDYYEEFDSYLGKLIEEKNVTIVILSGYGFDATIPQKTVDKIIVNKILEVGGLLSFDYIGEIDFSKTKAYSIEEGLEERTIIYLKAKNQKELENIKNNVFDIFSKTYIDSKPAFDVFKSSNNIILERKVPLQISYENIVIMNKKYPIQDFILRRIYSGRTTEEGIFIMYGDKIEKLKTRVKTVDDISPLILELIK